MKNLMLLGASAIMLAACQNMPNQSAGVAPVVAATPVDREVLPIDAVPVGYEIAIKPDMDAKTFIGDARLKINVKNSTDRVVVNGINLSIQTVLLDDETPVDFEIDAENEAITFLFDEALSEGEHTLDVDYTGRLYDNAAGIFFSTFPTPEGQESLLVSQFQPGDARKIAPMWDEPAHKAVFQMAAILPEGMDAISNMPVASTSPTDDGFVKIDFEPSPKMSSYLLFFGAGDFERLTRDHNGVELGIVTRKGESEKGHYALDTTVNVLDYFNEYFDMPYPLPKLDQIAAPGAGGFAAMENWGAILYFESFLLVDPKTTTEGRKQFISNVIAHEVAHQWFGNLVTMEWWDDIWLNEGFASWMDQKITDILNPERRVWLQAMGGKEFAMGLDSVSSTHPVVQHVKNIEEANTAFDAITYQKGEAVIRMIEAYVGEEDFRDGVRQYMKENAYGNAKTADLWRAIEAASEAPVSQIAHDFTMQPGVPMIYVDDVSCNSAGTQATVRVRQGRYGADEESKAEALVWRTPVTASSADSDTITRTLISGPRVQTIKVPGCRAVKLNAGETGYFRTNYGEEPFAALMSAYGDLEAEDQLGLLNDAYALGAANEAPFSRFLELVVNTPQDGDPTITRSIVGDLFQLNNLFKGEEGADLYVDFALNWLKPAFEQVGWDAKSANESGNIARLRSALIATLAVFNDEEIIKEAQRRFTAYQTDPSALNANLLNTVVTIVGAKADEETFDLLLSLARNADNPGEQRLYYGALDGVEDEALAKRAIEVFRSEEISAQRRPRYFRSMADDHPRLIWDYYREHFEEIEADVDPLERVEYGPNLAAATGDVEIAAELEEFAKENLPEASAKPVERAVKGIRYQASIKRDRLPEIVDWLRAQK